MAIIFLNRSDAPVGRNLINVTTIEVPGDRSQRFRIVVRVAFQKLPIFHQWDMVGTKRGYCIRPESLFDKSQCRINMFGWNGGFW